MADQTDKELRYCFVFVCQQGELELQAMLLAASLKRKLRCEHELVAAVPSPPARWGTIADATRRMFARVGVRICEVQNDFEPTYPIGNKVGCLSIQTDADKLVFLDSDILCMAEFHHDERFRIPVNAKAADLATFTQDLAIWERAYAAVGVSDMPAARMKMTVSGEESPPYFNSGVVAVNADLDFGTEWLRCCRVIDADKRIPNKRPWLDQAALPLAIAKLGVPYDVLDETYNYPVHLRPLTAERPPIFCHYHRPDIIAREPALLSLFKELADEHAEIRERVLADPRWRRLLRPPGAVELAVYRTYRSLVTTGRRGVQTLLGPVRNRWQRMHQSDFERRHNIIVTGVPRSGTSLYSATLNGIDNVVCLNEIYNTPHLHWLYHDLRRKINNRIPIPNKFSGSGRVTTNTIEGDTQVRRTVVEVLNDRFILGQKYTLPYLNRLPELVDEGWEIWLLVRHPAFAISSWKRCPSNYPVTHLDPPHPFFSEVRFTSKDLEQRRIDVWNYYARRIDACRAGINLVRYEDLVADIHAEVARFCGRYDLTPPPDLESVHSRNKPGQYAGMDDAFVARILDRCELSLFGYEN